MSSLLVLKAYLNLGITVVKANGSKLLSFVIVQLTLGIYN
jgi:hypothetical protein